MAQSLGLHQVVHPHVVHQELIRHLPFCGAELVAVELVLPDQLRAGWDYSMLAFVKLIEKPWLGITR
jgi:hypothetical protein